MGEDQEVLFDQIYELQEPIGRSVTCILFIFLLLTHCFSRMYVLMTLCV